MQFTSIVVIALSFSFVASSELWDIPGYDPTDVDTLFSRRLRIPLSNGDIVDGGLVVGQASAAMDAPAEAFLRVPTDDGSTVLVPKGVYHFSEKEEDVNGELVLPDMDNPIGWLKQMLKANTGVKSTDRTTDGVYIPLPFGMQPINFQLTTDNTDGRELDGGVGLKSVNEPVTSNNFFARTLLDSLHSTHDMMRRERGAKALEFAREICLYYDQVACDNALERYMNIRDGRIADIDVRRSEQNDQSGDEPSDVGVTDFANRLTHNVMDVMMPVLDQGINKLSSQPPPPPTSLLAALGGGREQKLNQRRVGLTLGFPGIDPVYVGGFIDNDKTNPFNIGIAPRPT